MTIRLLLGLLALLIVSPWQATADETGPPLATKVDPPSWWPRHSINPMRLLVRGTNLRGARVVSASPDVKPGEARINGRGTFLLVDLKIEPHARAGVVPLSLETSAGAAALPFRLEPPLSNENDTGRRGISQDDVIYLIMIDRFADGDPANNRPADGPPSTFNRALPRGFHGGDLQGIIDHLDYFQALGVTALWLTPWYDNFNGIYECDRPWCPYTYYHGYHTVDFYGVEDHFGSLDLVKKLVAKAHARGLKVIQDQISNHVSLHHPWVTDPPTATWFHGSPANHRQNPFRSELLLSPHAPASFRAEVQEGWFSDDSPDLNQQDPDLAIYLIQHAAWWLGATGVDGIREDTAQYVPRPFLSALCGAIHRQFPRVTIVGEVLDLDPMHTGFFLGGRAGWDGIDTGLDSVFDFPTWGVVVNALSGKAPMTTIRNILKSDAVYADAQRLTTLAGNHDLRRFPSWPGVTPDTVRLQLALTLALRGTPQLYYGDEIAMPGEGDPDNRRDFPGGFPGDPRSAFTAAGRTSDEQILWSWTRDWIALRKAHPALRRGSLIDLDAQSSIYVFARQLPSETLVLAFNRDGRPGTASFPAEALDARPGMKIVPLLPAKGELVAVNGQTVTLTLPPRSATAFQLR